MSERDSPAATSAQAWYRAPGPRLPHWPHCRSVRDVGGLPTTSGGRTRYGVLIRSDSLDRLTTAGIAAVRGAGVSRILDLRSHWEFPGRSHPFRNDPVYRPAPFIDEHCDGERDRGAERTRADLYRGSVDRNGRCIAAAVSDVATAPDGAVVVHCLSGTDRTGMLVALLLDAVGVHRAAIADDYALSRVDAAQDEAVGSRPGTRSILSSPVVPETIVEVLEHVDRAYGGVLGYLRRHEVSPRYLHRLQDRLVEPPT